MCCDLCISPISEHTKESEVFVDRPSRTSRPVSGELHHAENGGSSGLDLTILLHQTDGSERLSGRESVRFPCARLGGGEIKSPLTHPFPPLHAGTAEAARPVKENQRISRAGGRFGLRRCRRVHLGTLASQSFLATTLAVLKNFRRRLPRPGAS